MLIAFITYNNTIFKIEFQYRNTPLYKEVYKKLLELPKRKEFRKIMSIL